MDDFRLCEGLKVQDPRFKSRSSDFGLRTKEVIAMKEHPRKGAELEFEGVDDYCKEATDTKSGGFPNSGFRYYNIVLSAEEIEYLYYLTRRGTEEE